MPGIREDKREPTRAELDQLKDQLELFMSNEIWLGILHWMQTIYADSAEEALNNPGDAIKVAKASGMAQAVRMVTNFPQYITIFGKALGVQNGRRQDPD